MRICFLGTGTSQGIPVIGCQCPTCSSTNPKDKRLRVALWIQTDNMEDIVIDIGPDFRQQALTYNIPKVDAVLITHEHRDHIAGLDDLRPYNFRFQKSIDIFALPRVCQEIDTAFAYIFHGNYPGKPQLNLKTIEAGEIFQPIANSNTTLQAIEALHGELPILGFRIGNFAYFTDTKYLPDTSLALLEGVEVLVLSALHYEEHHSHNTVAQAIALTEKIKAKENYFIHMGHTLEPIEEASKKLPPNCHFAYDGLVLNL